MDVLPSFLAYIANNKIITNYDLLNLDCVADDYNSV